MASNGKKYTAPGRIPPGTYQVEAHFLDGDKLGIGNKTVADGDALLVVCEAALFNCGFREQ